MGQLYRYLALGDSYTIGESVEEAAGFPMQLVDRLRQSGFDFEKPRIIARTGWTTDELAAAIDRADVTDRFDLVTLLIGVNNQYRSRSLDEFRTQFHELLIRAIEFAQSERLTIVVSIPDWSVTPYARGRDRDLAKIAAEIDAFNGAKRELAERAGCPFVDITDITRKDDSQLIATDGLHPSPRMYARWVDRIAPVAVNALRARANGGNR